ncbi:hypothetical protein [Caulobacter sp. BE254]|uniref:hypothetical protein n=1 Tax=Caulobacter sp. BE254 TaxID=2817720 RepID=UPI0028639ED5|nr:hypothetical protein [Caulobacter sp. BE254]MDR7114144.1 hypothetical protein [Caulobacter sp. BE254]
MANALDFALERDKLNGRLFPYDPRIPQPPQRCRPDRSLKQVFEARAPRPSGAWDEMYGLKILQGQAVA